MLLKTMIGLLEILVLSCACIYSVATQDIVGCGGFVQSKVPIHFERVEVKLYTKQGALKFKTESAPNNGYFLVAVYDKGDYILKLDPPNGWSFDPMEFSLHIDGKTDPCAKGEDINFKFAGFSLTGIVGSEGRPQGPSGVELELVTREAATEVEPRKNYTVDGGVFIFSRVMPGQYLIKASHPSWTFSTDQAIAAVSNDNTFVDKAIVVSGYDVKGHVLSAGEPIQGVTFILFSKDVTAESLSGCEKVPDDMLAKLGKKMEETALCAALSGKDGVFTFPSVPSGEYSLIPHYSSQYITFDVVPTKVTFVVNYRSIVIKTPFQVHGFSVTGKIVDSTGGGIEGAKVEVKAEGKSAVTTADGVYLLENVTSGTYTIEVSKKNIFFDPLQVHISPNTPQLPDIQARRYGVCGQVIITQTPQGAHPISQRKVMLLPKGSQNTEMITANTNEHGHFCLQAAPGDYKLEALVSPAEVKLGLKLKPAALDIRITSFPLIDIKFTQFFATISGIIECIGSCDDTIVTLVSSDRNVQAKTIAKIEKTDSGVKFAFESVLPGKYKVTPVKHRWCWQPRNLEIEIVDADVTNAKFSHVGYILKCILSHNITMNFTVEGTETVGAFNVSKGTNKFCLKVPGVYHLTPISCYKFEKETYIYNTADPSVLTLSSTTYQLKVDVKVRKIVSDLAVSIRTSGKPTEDIVPLELTAESMALLAANSSTNELSPTNETKAEPKVENLLYGVTTWARLGETLLITPQSKEVLFYPENQQVVLRDDCPGGHVSFEGRDGIFIRGSVQPPLMDVEITIQTFATGVHKEAKALSVLTDQEGKYSVGPLHSDVEYQVHASKKGFVISELDNQKGSFMAMKLGEIIIKVIDEEGNPMHGVLLSLSGGKYRNNNLTPTDGTLSFTDLSPGQYFLRPMLKEYSFIPNSQMINVTEGDVVNIAVQGKRVAFSCNGFVTTLAGDSVKGVVVEALGEGDCRELQEETTTDNTGSYRIRGLEPQCSYFIRVKIGDVNPDIERAGPVSRVVRVSEGDVDNMNFIVFYKPESFELTASIDTDTEYLSSIKILVYKGDNLMSPILTVSPGAYKFIHFPRLPLTEELYTVKVESSLSKKLYDFEGSSVSFSTKTGYNAHLELTFKAKRKKTDPEPTQSVMALPFAVAVVLLANYYELVFQFFAKIGNKVQEIGSGNTDSADISEEGTKSKKKKR